MNIQNNSITFTSRTKEIRMGYDVCHKINQELTHQSPTKLYCMCENVGKRIGNSSRYSPERRVYRNGYRGYEQVSKKLNLMRALEKYSVDVSTPYLKAKNVISQFKEYKVANCAENADVAAIILKMNGIDNACSAAPENIDHVFCVFNRDGSRFNGKVTRDTIIVDPLASIVDFASSALKRMKYTLSYCKEIKPHSSNSLTDIREINLSNSDILQLRKDFPELVFQK